MLITEAYREQQATLHENPNYGVASLSYANDVAEWLHKTGALQVLDYGAGKGRLGQELKKANYPGKIYHYDPAIPEWSDAPSPTEFVTCIDVLEHIEPELLDNVLDDLRRVTEDVGYFTVHTGPAMKRLSDGRNAHLTQEPLSWWFPKFEQRFEFIQINNYPSGFSVVVK